MRAKLDLRLLHGCWFVVEKKPKLKLGRIVSAGFVKLQNASKVRLALSR